MVKNRCEDENYTGIEWAPAIRYAAFMIQFGEGDCRCREESIVCLGFGMLESVFESSEKMVFFELFMVVIALICLLSSGLSVGLGK